MTDEPVGRSAEACPRCGAHRLAVATPPKIVDLGYQPLNEVYSIHGEVTDPVAPGIECLACGTIWGDLEALRAEESGGASHDPA